MGRLLDKLGITEKSQSEIYEEIYEKLNPAQDEIVDDYGETHSPSVKHYTNQQAYEKLEVVNRGINLITDAASGMKLDVGEILEFSGSPTRIRKKKINSLLNFQPNPYYNSDTFKRNIFMDLLLEGDAFVYWDGVYLYHLPALNVEIIADKITFIKGYKYGDEEFKPNEVIHIRENSGMSIYTGTSRLDAAKESMELLLTMQDYQQNFFDNSAIPGLVLSTPNPLSQRVKDRIVGQWVSRYNPKKGGRKPMIIDGDFKMESLSKYNFNELDFNDSIMTQENKILKALGVPPILLDSGNNANITPNLRMFYITTILPLVEKYVQALEVYFGYDIKPVTQDVLALRPELRDLSAYLTGLTNAGIISRNEARAEVRYPEHDQEFADDLILPANIAGSAVDPNVGGAPNNNENEEDD
jgi:HK97 family phage portal protein